MPSAYITPTGQKILTAELKWLWKHKRPYATRKVKEAAALGDRSENADYHYNKRLLREIDRRIAYLSKRLDVLQVINRAPKDKDRVFFGAWIDIELDGTVNTYRIVGPDEIDFAPHYISIDAPLACAALGKHCGDHTRFGRIAAIRYDAAGDDTSLNIEALVKRFQHFPMQL